VELRVLHVPDAVGGQAAGLARAERELGLESVAVALDPSPFGYEMDEVLRRSPGRFGNELARWRLLWRAMRDFDVVHFNFGRTIAPAPQLGLGASRTSRAYAAVFGLRDLPLLRRAGKGILVTFQGDDVRQGDVLRRTYAESVANANPSVYHPAGDRAKRRVVAAFDRYAHQLYYLNPDLARVLPARAEFLPYASVDLAQWRRPERASVRPLVLHAPSDRLTKGTEYVLAAVESARAAGADFDFRLVEGLPHEEARDLYADADLYVDQLHVGWYGAAAVELMALETPTLCFVRDEDLGVLPKEMRAELPLIPTTPATVADALLTALAEWPDGLRERGRRSRAFVERWHDPRAIAARLAADYEQARWAGLYTRGRERSGAR
jgi:hypothetical protein